MLRGASRFGAPPCFVRTVVRPVVGAPPVCLFLSPVGRSCVLVLETIAMPSTFLFVMVRLPTSLCAWSALQLVPLDAPRQRQRNKAEPQAPAALRGETLFYINNGKSAPADVAVHELAHCLGQPVCVWLFI